MQNHFKNNQNNQNSRKLQQKHKNLIARLEGYPKSSKKASKKQTMELEMLQKQRNLATYQNQSKTN